jgi:hypothetical protein
METAEQVASVHSASVILAQDGQLGRRIWRLQQAAGLLGDPGAAALP